MKVLEGIRVLDFGRFIAGPFCAALLADYGADVIRVDRVGGSEDRYVMPVTQQGEGAVFLQANRNKRSLTLNIASPEGQEVLHRLLLQADVVVANMPPRTLASLGLDYDSLRAIKPDIILAAASAFGSHPAVSDRVGFDGVGQAMSGAVHVGGLPDHPMKAMVPVVDFATALASALGTVMALYERKSSGMGQEVGASLLQTGLNLAGGSLIEESVLKPDRKAMLNRSPHYGPSDIFRASDGWLIVQVIGPAMFRRWALLIDMPELVEDSRFADDRTRGENGQALSDFMAAWCAQRTRGECLAVLEKARIPAGPILSPRQVLEEQTIAADGPFNWVRYPGIAEPLPIAVPPFSMSRTPAALERRPPMAGEHTDEVLQTLGYAQPAIDEMRARGIV
jgi:crotonobetainyl-CoA:carnitine CoA-transferase CaiB-like acyl-CoA transferase